MCRPGSPYGDNSDNGTIYTITANDDSGESMSTMVIHWRSIGDQWWQWLLWWQWCWGHWWHWCQWIANDAIGANENIGGNGAKGNNGNYGDNGNNGANPSLPQTHTLTIVTIGANKAIVANGSPLNRHCHYWHHQRYCRQCPSFWCRSWPWYRHLMAPLITTIGASGDEEHHWAIICIRHWIAICYIIATRMVITYQLTRSNFQEAL